MGKNNNDTFTDTTALDLETVLASIKSYQQITRGLNDSKMNESIEKIWGTPLEATQNIINNTLEALQDYQKAQCRNNQTYAKLYLYKQLNDVVESKSKLELPNSTVFEKIVELLERIKEVFCTNEDKGQIDISNVKQDNKLNTYKIKGYITDTLKDLEDGSLSSNKTRKVYDKLDKLSKMLDDDLSENTERKNAERFYDFNANNMQQLQSLMNDCKNSTNDKDIDTILSKNLDITKNILEFVKKGISPDIEKNNVQNEKNTSFVNKLTSERSNNSNRERGSR